MQKYKPLLVVMGFLAVSGGEGWAGWSSRPAVQKPPASRAPEARSAVEERHEGPSAIMPARSFAGGAAKGKPSSSASTGSISRSISPRDLGHIHPQHQHAFASTHRGGRTQLASITAYWSRGRGTDRWTRQGLTSTGMPLKHGVVAVDPRVIPYGSLVKIDGINRTFWAADCGSAVRRRTAAMRLARTSAERRAIVVDVYFPTEREGRDFDQKLPKFVKVTYFPPG